MHVVRAAVAAMVVAVSPVLSAAPCAGFNDVSDSDPFCVYVDWMKNRGITLGLTPTQYDPAGFVTRMQMAAFMYRLGYQNAFLQGGNAFGATAVLGTSDAAPLELHVEGERIIRFEHKLDGPNIVGGGSGNVAEASASAVVIAGGGYSSSLGDCSLPGYTNNCTNRAGGLATTIGGGYGNRVEGLYSAVLGGLSNRATGGAVFIGGGGGNLADAAYAVVPGGYLNAATGIYSAVLGGTLNVASGRASLAVGQSARADQQSCSVFNNWQSGQEAGCNGWPYSFHFYGENGVSIDYNARLAGGFGNRWVHIGKQVTGQTIATWTTAHLSDTGQWQSVSDVAKKADFAEVDKGSLLDQVVALPVHSWRYRADPGGPRHVGPTAQDFNATFGLGEGITTIGSIDANGVALGAIQGLNAKLESRLAAKDAEITSLRAAVAELAALRAELVELRSVRAEVAAIRAALPSNTVTASAHP